MAKGLKRVCMGCKASFYDMEKRPIICPKCKEEWEIKSPILPAAEKEDPKATNKDDEIDKDQIDGENLVSLNDIDEDNDDDEDNEFSYMEGDLNFNDFTEDDDDKNS